MRPISSTVGSVTLPAYIKSAVISMPVKVLGSGRNFVSFLCRNRKAPKYPSFLKYIIIAEIVIFPLVEENDLEGPHKVYCRSPTTRRKS